MRILVTRYPYESQLSGEEWHTIQLAEKLRKRGHLVFFSGSCKILSKQLKDRGFEVVESWGGLSPVSKKALCIFPFTAGFVFFNFLRLLLFFKYKKKIDIIYMQSLNEKLLMTPLALLLGLKVLWVEHARIGRWLLKNPFLFLYKMWSQWVSIVCVSKQQSYQLNWLKNLNTIINGVDTTFFKPINGNRADFLAKKNLKIDEGERIIGAVARLYKDKGINILLEAFAKLLHKNTEVQLLIVGIGPEKEKLIKLARKLLIFNRVHFLGEISRVEMPEFYNCLDVFVLPSSLHDPFGLVVAEAMACRKPVIVTRICGIADNITNYKNGLVIKENDFKVLSTAIYAILNDSGLSSYLALEGHKLCISNFSLNRMVRNYEKLMLLK